MPVQFKDAVYTLILSFSFSSCATKIQEPNKILGGVDPMKVRSVFRENIGNLRSCIKIRDSKKYFYRATFGIGASGVPEDLKVANLEGSPSSVGECLKSKIAEIRFPPPNEGQGVYKVTQPINFKPKEMN